MRRYSVIVVHINYKAIESITARRNTTGELVTLLRDNVRPHQYQSFQHLYGSVLNILKENSMAVHHWDAFGSRFYDIQWINTEKPAVIETFGYRKEVMPE